MPITDPTDLSVAHFLWADDPALDALANLELAGALRRNGGLRRVSDFIVDIRQRWTATSAASALSFLEGIEK